ncbi:hypothetical protein ACIRP0_24110 [Streptomyces sp. NPDC101733]|uniref:hypothetical protein n=1 Tax=unclassified Streptomyces TaxID=2593676 RepID=UPI00381D36D7
MRPEDLDRLDALVAAHQTAETRWQAAAEQEARVLTCAARRCGRPAHGSAPSATARTPATG